MIHALENCDPKARVLLNSMLLGRRAAGATRLGHKELMISIVEQTGSLQYTVEILSALHRSITELVDLMDKKTGKVNEAFRGLLAALYVKNDESRK